MKREKPKNLLKPLILDNPFKSGPELPDRMVWTVSSIKLWRRCKRKWFWKLLLRLSPRFRALALMMGWGLHSTLQEWYPAARISMAKIVQKYVKELSKEATVNSDFYDQEELDKLHMAINTFAGMMMGYAEVYSSDKKKFQIKKSLVEPQFCVDMGDFDFMGKIDMIPCLKKTPVIFEHKTAATINEAYIARLPLDTQVRGYVFGAWRGLKIKVKKVYYNVIRKCKLRRKSNETIAKYDERVAFDYQVRPEFYFHREPLIISSSDIAAFELELRQTDREFRNTIREAIKADMNPLDPRAWVCNDSECNAFFKKCPFLPLCTMGLDKGTGMLFKQRKTLYDELEFFDE